MRKLYIISIFIFYFLACSKKVSLPEIDISVSKDGVVELPDSVPDIFKKYFVSGS